MSHSRRLNYCSKVIFLCIIFSVAQINGVVAQDNDYKNNSIYASIGTAIFTAQYSISYERTIIRKNDNLRLRLKANYGKYILNGLDLETDEKEYKNHKSISAVLLFELFEANVGVAFTQYTLAQGFMPRPNVDYTEVLNGKTIYACTGIRYEKNNFMVRAGISSLELLYAGIGINF